MHLRACCDPSAATHNAQARLHLARSPSACQFPCQCILGPRTCSPPRKASVEAMACICAYIFIYTRMCISHPLGQTEAGDSP
eukprot:7586033-Pyramimonas_sp.AAC.1